MYYSIKLFIIVLVITFLGNPKIPLYIIGIDIEFSFISFAFFKLIIF